MDSTQSVDSLVEKVLLGSCVVVNNIKYRGAKSGLGYFDAGNTNIGLQKGIIISTGNIANCKGPNDQPGKSTEFNTAGDADLTNLASVQTHDAAVLEFDFISSSDTVKFNYVFASEEYPEFVGAGYNDIFVFYVSGPGIPVPRNIAVVPGTPVPVSIDNVNQSVNSQYFVNNTGGASIQFDGFTVPLEAKVYVTPGETYHMKIAIADAEDTQTDSGVFLEAGSFRSGQRITLKTINNPVEGCRDGVLRITRDENIGDSLEITLFVTGNAKEGLDYYPIPRTITMYPGQTTLDLKVVALQDSLSDPSETIVITLDNRCIGTNPAKDTWTVLENGLVVDLVSQVEICAGASYQLDAKVKDGVPPYRYRWYPAAGLSDTTVHNPIASPSVTTVYTLEVLDSYGCANYSTVRINVDDVRANAGPDITLCNGGQGSIGAAATGGKEPYRYRWSPAPGLDSDTVRNPIASPSVTTRYALTVTGANGCFSIDSVTVFVQLPLLPNAGNDTLICRNTAAHLSASATGGGAPYRYQWMPAADLDNPLLAFPTARPLQTTKYYVTITDTLGCSATDSVTVRINDISAHAGVDKMICAGASIVIGDTARGGTGGYRYLWTPATGLSSTTARLPIANPAVTTTYILEATDSYGCTALDTMTLAVGDQIIPTIQASGKTELCEGETVFLSAPSGYQSYLWSNGATTPGVTVGISDTLTVTVMDNFGCSGTSAPMIVRVNPLPQPVVDGPNSVCQNSRVRYHADALPGGAYSWTVNGGTILSGDGTTEIEVEWNTLGAGQVQLTLRAGATGCANTASYDVSVAISLKPELRTNRPAPYCIGDSVIVAAPSGYTKYRWNTGDTTRWIAVRQPGSYSVEVELDPQCRGTSDPIAIAFLPPPQPGISALGSTAFCEGDSVILDAGAGHRSYRWSTGDTTRFITARATGAYTVEVETPAGCKGISLPVGVLTETRPPVPAISRSIDSLFSTPAETYQWYRNDTLLAGEDGSFLIIVEPGIYRVVVSNAAGCATSSDALDVTTPLATSVLIIPVLEAAPGERIKIPLILAESSNLLLAGVKDYQAVLRVDRSVLLPVNNAVIPVVDGNENVFTLTGTLGDTVGVLQELEFMAMLGPVASVPLRIERFRWVNSFVRIQAQDGEFRLRTCEEGGQRLFDGSSAMQLAQNHPNPFNMSTVIRFTLMEDGLTELAVYDRLGRKVAVVLQEELNAGEYAIRFDAGDLPSGAYRYVLNTPTRTASGMMQVLK